MTIINIDQIVSITVIENKLSWFYSWEKSSKLLGITTKKEGVYDIFGNWIGQEIPEKHFLINGNICERPQVILKLSNGETLTSYFNTIEEANEFVDKIYIAKPLKLE